MAIEPDTAPPLEYPIDRLKRLQFFLERIDFGRTIAMRIATPPDEVTGRIAVATSIRFETFEDTNVAPDPAPLKLTLDAAQKLMDELWHCGLRPSEGTGSAGALAATQNHLKDMRAVAFKLLAEEQHLANNARERGLAPQPPFFDRGA